MPSLVVRNDADTLLCIFVEPLGEDFWVAPKSSLRVTATASDDEVETTWHQQGVSVWMSDADAYGFLVTTEDGKPFRAATNARRKRSIRRGIEPPLRSAASTRLPATALARSIRRA